MKNTRVSVKQVVEWIGGENIYFDFPWIDDKRVKALTRNNGGISYKIYRKNNPYFYLSDSIDNAHSDGMLDHPLDKLDFEMKLVWRVLVKIARAYSNSFQSEDNLLYAKDFNWGKQNDVHAELHYIGNPADAEEYGFYRAAKIEIQPAGDKYIVVDEFGADADLLSNGVTKYPSSRLWRKVVYEFFDSEAEPDIKVSVTLPFVDKTITSYVPYNVLGMVDDDPTNFDREAVLQWMLKKYRELPDLFDKEFFKNNMRIEED